jgi:hypothetical protein
MEVQMRKPKALFALILIVCVVVSCKLAETLTGNPSAGTVSSLWPDVPPFEGAKKADLEIPLGARLLIRTMMQGKVNFIAFTTDRSAEEVKSFYSADRMKSNGWKPNEKGCIGDTDTEKTQGAVCLFEKKAGDQDDGLAIVLAQDEKTKQTEIFYARIDLTQPSPSPSKR